MVQKDFAMSDQNERSKSSTLRCALPARVRNHSEVHGQESADDCVLVAKVRSAQIFVCEAPSGIYDVSSRIRQPMECSCIDLSGDSAVSARLRCNFTTASSATSENTAVETDRTFEPRICYSIAHRKDILRLDSGNSRVSPNFQHDLSIPQCSDSCYQTVISSKNACDKYRGEAQYCETIVSCCGDTDKFRYNNNRHRNDVKNNKKSCYGSCLDVQSSELYKEPSNTGCDVQRHGTVCQSPCSTTGKNKWRTLLSTFLLALLLTSGSATPVAVYKVNRWPGFNESSSNTIKNFSPKYDYRLNPNENTTLDTSSPFIMQLNMSDVDSNLTRDYDRFLISSYSGPPTSLAVGTSDVASNGTKDVWVSRYSVSGTLDPDRDILDWMDMNGINTDEVQGKSKQINKDGKMEDYFDDFDAALLQPATADEEGRIRRFDPARFNYTVLRQVLDGEMQVINKRQGRFFDTDSYAYRLPRFLSHLGRMLDIETVVNEIETSIMTSVSCNACKGGVGLLQHYIDQGKTKEDIVRAASKLCTNFRVETPRVCFGIIQLMSDEVVYVMENLVMEPDGICGFLIGDVCGIPHDPYHKWRVLFPPYPKPPVPLIRPPKEDMPTYKVLHLSDTHFDPYYEEGSNADCNEPMCCRSTSGRPATEEAQAGKWGDYRKCDTPERTIKSMFENIAHTHPDIDYILWTGDLPPHDIWNQTRDSNLLVLRETVQQLFDYFPNTPVFPALGNHESAPVNSFPPPSIPPQHSVQWLYNELEKQWRRWLPAYTSPTILKGGYYSVEVIPGFRIVSLNMNYCNNKNWWLLLDSEDPADQLQWLVYELQAAELKNEKVHIIGHIPPGYHDCLRVWSHNFYTIVNRYELTVTAQFYGHTHYDEFEVFYELEKDNTTRATNVAFVAPSVTTYTALNPGYRLYFFEGGPGNDHRVVDHETWVMNLDEANHPNNVLLTPHWYPLYSARSAYDMRSLLPADWDNLVYRMVADDSLFQMFYRHYWKNSPKRDACDSECKKRILCDLRSGRSNDRKKTCAVVHERVEAQERSQWRNWIFSGFTVTYVWIKKQLGL